MPADPIRQRKARVTQGPNSNLTETTLYMIAKILKVNWKTTAGGLGSIGAALTAIAETLADGLQVGDIQPLSIAAGLLIGGLGLLFARDGDKSTEDQKR